LEGVSKRLALDLSDQNITTSAALDAFPDAIVNCAAVSVPDQCDVNPALAEKMNVDLPTTLAKVSHHLNARLVHLSSEQVFDGTRAAPYAASDAVSPINLYGQQKIRSERAVHEAAPNAVTVRAPLLMGNSAAGQRSNHERLLADWAAGRTPKLFIDEYRQTCTAGNLAEVLLELCERNDLHGVFHWAGAELISRYDLGVRIRDHFKLTPQEAPVVGVARAENPDAMRKRQACLALDISPLAGKLKTRPQSIAEQLEELNVPAPVRAWYLSR
jgi:dTDP-4-dehydrorhamnose reductase